MSPGRVGSYPGKEGVSAGKETLSQGENLVIGTKNHLPLVPGTVGLVQNQVGPDKTIWNKTGVIIADKGHSQCEVKLDESGRVSFRNRAFLKRIVPYMERTLKEGPRLLELNK